MKRILVATDFSPCAHAAAGVAARLAGQLNAMVDAMTMLDASAARDAGGDAAFRQCRIDQMRAEAQQRLEAFADQHFKEIEDVRVHVVDGGSDPDAARDIVRAAEALESDLVALGTHGKTGLEHLVLGSVAEKVVRTSTVPVLTVRHK